MERRVQDSSVRICFYKLCLIQDSFNGKVFVLYLVAQIVIGVICLDIVLMHINPLSVEIVFVQKLSADLHHSGINGFFEILFPVNALLNHVVLNINVANVFIDFLLSRASWLGRVISWVCSVHVR